jgi:hypothetical protein
MSQLDRDLRESLRRKQPPSALASKVLERTRAAGKHRIDRWRWLAVAAVIVLMVGGVFINREQRQRAEREKAKQQLMVAFRITGAKVRDMQMRLSAAQERIVYPQLNP